MTEAAEILSRSRVSISPYVRLVEKEARLEPDGRVESFHGLSGSDYVSVLAVAEDGRMPLVRQYRPIIERHTWELPSGTVDVGEPPETSIVRELEEETGFVPGEAPVFLGQFAADVGRLEIAVHFFLMENVRRREGWRPEAGVACELFTRDELDGLIRSGEFCHSMHLGCLYLAARQRGELAAR